MTRRLMMAGVLAGLIVATAPAAAHDDYRIIGTVTKVTANTLDVKQTKDGRTIAMATDEATLVTRDKKKVSATGVEGRAQRGGRCERRQPGRPRGA